MTDLTQLSPEELFTRTLRLFDKKNEANENEDFIYARDASDYEREFKEYMRTLFRNLCQEQVDPVKRNKLIRNCKPWKRSIIRKIKLVFERIFCHPISY